MNGIELARDFFIKHGKPMIDEQFNEIKDRHAFGLVGEGSE